MTDDDFRRLEGKVDKMADAVMKLVLVEERQANQGERIGRVEQRLAAVETATNKTDRTLQMWINRGIGVWGVAVVVFTLVQFGSRWVK
jgi:anti-sigma-K factor RskA